MVTVCISQPGYMPYLGFFHKIQHCDVFVYFDDVQYEIRGFHNRNKIRTIQGTSWLTVPLSHPYGKMINQVKIVSTDWNEKHKNAIKNSYEKAPYFEKYWDDIDSILSTNWEKLIDLNLALIKYFNSVLSMKTKTVRSSELNIQSTGSLRLLDICKKLNAKTYFSGIMGKEYIDEKIFLDTDIKITFQNFTHPVYNQIHGEFIPNMSIIDLLFNEGNNSKKILFDSSV